GHDEQQRRIEVARHIEETEHDVRVAHAAEHKPDAEQCTGEEGRDDALHGAAPNTWRTTNTVAIAAPQNTITATIDRFDKRPMPHTPCPLVQPPPIVAP